MWSILETFICFKNTLLFLRAMYSLCWILSQDFTFFSYTILKVDHLKSILSKNLATFLKPNNSFNLIHFNTKWCLLTLILALAYTWRHFMKHFRGCFRLYFTGTHVRHSNLEYWAVGLVQTHYALLVLCGRKTLQYGLRFGTYCDLVTTSKIVTVFILRLSLL